MNPQFDYESKALYASEFEGMRSMFQLCGGALSFIVGLVGVLNFFNAILTGIIARKREFAVLRSVGMSVWQAREAELDTSEDFERVHVARTIEELVTRSEIIQDALAHDRLMIVGARYQLSTGKVEVLSF